MKNTPKNGSFKWLVFYDTADVTWYGVALDFNIVVSGENYATAFLDLQEAVAGYIIASNKVNGLKDYSFLNQDPLPEYFELWKASQAQLPIPSPYSSVTSGITNEYAKAI